MHRQPKEKQCAAKDCSNTFIQYNSLQKYCSPHCLAEQGKVPKIKKVSEKRKAQQIVYNELRRLFLNRPENQICPITKQPTTDVHHRKGRVGSLYLDTRYWLAVSREGHQKIEANPEWAYEMGYSLKRIENNS